MKQLNANMSAEWRAAVLAHLPALIIGLAVLWHWVVILWDWAPLPLKHYRPHWDIIHYMYFGQRLVEGSLLWTSEYNDRLPVDQFLFWLPAKFNSVEVWLSISIAACLAGAWAVYAILRDVFSPDRGFPLKLGHYAGLYGGVFTLYLFAALDVDRHGGIHQINILPMSLALLAAVLTKRCVGSRALGVKMALAFIAACFCASVAVGIRPYFVLFVGLIPAWVFIAAQLDVKAGGVVLTAKRLPSSFFCGTSASSCCSCVSTPYPISLPGNLASSSTA